MDQLFFQLMGRYLSGEIDGGEMNRFRQHLDANESSKQTYLALAEFWRHNASPEEIDVAAAYSKVKSALAGTNGNSNQGTKVSE